MAEVVFDEVAKRYGDVLVIEGLNLAIRDQEFMVLVGPSGCGKSTALRMIAGLEAISSGTIRIGDRVVNDVPPRDRDIAMVFQSYALYPHMTVRQNLGFGLRMRKTPPPEVDRLVVEAAETLGIAALLDRKPKELSGGQRQRVAVGRALVRRPSVFLFDEPLSNLDAKLRVQMRAEISRLQAKLLTTTVYVTHDQVEAMTMGHRIAVLEAGKLQQVGTPLEIYEKPANLFVAAFIGAPPMSFIHGAVDDSGSRIVAPGFSFPVPRAMLAAAASRRGRPVVAGVRPENLLDPATPASGPTARLPLEVEIVEPLGHEVVVHGRAGEDRLIAKFDPHRAPRMGERIEVAIELEALTLFDPDTGLRLEA
jgi:multiple sugar transport system ATP-binding protein